MMTTFDDFHGFNIKANWASLCKEQGGNPGKTPKDVHSRAHSLYANILNSELPFIIIGGGVKNDGELKGNIGHVTSTPLKKKGRAERKVNHHAGAILGENPWSLFINDVFMLGAIHRACEVHLALSNEKVPERSVLWDENKKRFKPLGRELAILFACNYQRVNVDKTFGIIFSSCEGSDKNGTLTFTELRESISKVKIEDIQNLLKNKTKENKEIAETEYESELY